MTLSALALTLLAVQLCASPPRATPEQARRLAEQLRYEEAILEYQRYLETSPPEEERALALFELAFLEHLLGDERRAQEHAASALDLKPELALPPTAAKKQREFLDASLERQRTRTRLTLLPRGPEQPPEHVRARLSDPKQRVERVLLRHAVAPSGPFFGEQMRCEREVCEGELPAPGGRGSHTAWYFLEALDKQGNTLAQAATPSSPLQISVVQRSPWYKSPWVWISGGVLLVGAAAVAYVASAPPAR